MTEKNLRGSEILVFSTLCTCVAVGKWPLDLNEFDYVPNLMKKFRETTHLCSRTWVKVDKFRQVRLNEIEMWSVISRKNSIFVHFSMEKLHGKTYKKSEKVVFRSVGQKPTLRSVVRNRLRPTDFDRLWTLFRPKSRTEIINFFLSTSIVRFIL